jgi:type II secretory pathway component PulJ
MRRCGFTLVEMLLATMLSALLLGGVLLATAAIARDTARARASIAPASHALDLLRWDLLNAASMRANDNGTSLTLLGQCALDRRALGATGRFARVIYRVDPATRLLTREQRYLDDAIHPEPWIELVATNVSRLDISTTTNDQKPDAQGNVAIPVRITIALQRAGGVVSAEVRVR